MDVQLAKMEAQNKALMKLSDGLDHNSVDAPAQGASSYVERIHPASELRKLEWKWLESGPFFCKKVPLHILRQCHKS